MTDKELYKQARKRVQAKREVINHAIIYLVICTMLTVIFFATGGHGLFWPIFPMVGWGAGVAIHAATVFTSQKNFDSEVEKEFLKLKATSGEKFSPSEDYNSNEN